MLDEHSSDRDEDAPVAQSRVATEAAAAADDDDDDDSDPAGARPGSLGDPMASIRPKLPGPAPLIDATVPLSERPQPDAESLDIPTLEPPATRHAAVSTRDLGPVIPVLEPGTPAREYDEGLAYQLVNRIGAGGMGEVWEARQRELWRTVAVKRLREAKRGDDAIVTLFKNEARLTALLDHPNIVTVHELGRDQAGRAFYSMKRIVGTPWSDVIATNRRRTAGGEVVRVEMRDHLEFLLEVSHAIAFAHSRHVIHRDIKPANVVIGDYGEVLVIDWGLAVAMCPLPGFSDDVWTKDRLPKSALVCGTPAYMSPETANAERERIGPATDVYLLGAVLFHLLYGRPPHRGKSVENVMAQAKLNAWTIPDELSARQRPWDALLRPVINRALASDPELRYPDAGEFGDALREAIRNYESAKVASQAQEQLVNLELRGVAGPEGYQRFAALIARLEGALESWPGNLTARQTLAEARLRFAALALANGDLALARLNVAAYEQLPPLPAPESASVSRRLTAHPVDGTLISAPRPPDSLDGAASSNRWISSLEQSKANPLARTLGAADMARANTLDAEGSGPHAGRRPSTGGFPGREGASPAGSLAATASIASVEIQQSSEAMLDEEHQHAATAVRLLQDIGARERLTRRRRISLKVAGSVGAALLLLFGVSVIHGRLAVGREHQRAMAERDQLSKALLDETANTVEAELAAVLGPVDAALATARAWARAGMLDSDDPRELNRYYMPLLAGAASATSALRADTAGNEYMLLTQPDGWRTRVTAPGLPRTHQPGEREASGFHGRADNHEWSTTGQLRDTWPSEEPHDPRESPWYQGALALGDPEAVFWTSPYSLVGTQQIGVSISAPATSPSGRSFVLAFDLELGDISEITGALPRGIDRGQVFVLDQQLRTLALPRELTSLDPATREQLLLRPLAELERAPISRAAVQHWQQTGDDGPFRLTLGDGEQDNFWAAFRLVDKPHRPKVWIGVVVPESHFLD